MKSIESRKDVELLVDSFYAKVRKDDVIGYIFNDVANLDWDKHMPIMYSFWSSILLGDAPFQGDPMGKHIMLDKKEALLPKHFDRWLELWEANLNEHFEGANAEEALRRAKLMSQLILYKAEQSRKSGFIQ